MTRLTKLLPLLVAAPLCTPFSPSNPTTRAPAAASRRERHALKVTRNEGSELERMGKAAGSAILAATIGFAAVAVPYANANAATMTTASSFGTSVTLSRGSTLTDEDAAIKYLEAETRQAEREARIDAKKARVERGREAFFEYEARQAERTEERIEAAERKAELEAQLDREEVETLRTLEQKKEREAEAANSKEERALKRKEAKALLAKEREYERKERRAERAERVYLAEELQEQKILAQKEKAARDEEEKFEAVEQEYEAVAEIAKEDEEELKLAKVLLRKK